jgi:uncharacterized alpha-E superfamily protein
MLSRVADNLYWFGRYLQRAENTARLVSVHSHLVLDLPRTVEFGWGPLVQIQGEDTMFKARYSDASDTSVTRFLMLDEDNPGSIASSLYRAREILRTVRDTMPSDAWEQLNDLHYYVRDKGEKALTRARRQEFLEKVIEGALLIDGILVSNMSQDVGFQFLRIGTNIEQADMTSRIIDVRSSNLILPKAAEDLSPIRNIQWMGVLRGLTAYHMFRRHVRARVNGPNVLRFLLQNREFPRSVVYCVNTVASTLPKLPSNRKVERAVDRLRALVLDANIDRLIEGGLHDFMDDIQLGLAQLHAAMSEAYFKS